MIKKLFVYLISGLMMSGILGIVYGVNTSMQTDGTYADPNMSYNPNVAGSQAMQGDNIIVTIRNWINWFLTILGLLCLIMLLWGGFQMITAAGDDGKYKKGFTILKQAAIGLLFIGVAWIIIGLIYFFVAGAATT